MPPVETLTFYSRAMEAVNRGLSVIPCKPRSKEPLAPNGAKSRVNTEAGVLAFAARVPEDCNFGICSDENFTIVETDDRAKFFECLGRPMPATLTVSARPNRGYFVFENTDRARSISGCPKSSEAVFEWRRENQYCCGWGSIHPGTGKPYELIKDLKPIPIPDWLVDRLLELSQNKIQKAIEVTDEEKGSYDLEILGNVLQLWGEQNPAFEFTEGRTQEGSGFYIRCPGVDGWQDGSQHSEAYKGLSSTAACWVTNGHPRWRCHHTHCGNKSWKDLVAALGASAQRRVLTGSPLFGEARKPDRRATEQFLADSDGRSNNVDLPGGQAPLPGASENVDGDGVGAGSAPAPGTDTSEPLLDGARPATETGTEGEQPARIRAFTDLGNTERFLDRHKDSFRFTSGKGWYSFDGTRWVPESDAAVNRAAWETVRAIGDEPGPTTEPGERNPMTPRKWMRQSESAARVSAIVSMAKSAGGICVKEEEFDQHDWLFNTVSGTIDLKTGTLHPHDRSQLLSTISPVKFDPRAECPKWMEFLEKVMQGDQELVSFLQRLAGYTMSGSVAEQAFCVNWGEGSNGKSTYLDVLSTVMGGYADTTPFNTFSERKNGGIPNDLAALHKARMVICSEGARTTKLAEAMIKNVTGSETVSARFLHHEFFSFRPKFTLFLQSNHKPVITGTDHGIWRRVRFIPWLYTFSDAEINKHWAQEEVEAEGPGILNWMIKGCLEYQRICLAEPEVVRAAIAQYRENSDTLGIWLKDECTKVPGHETPSGGFYAVYRSWARDTGEDAITAQEFKTEMLKRGYGWKKTKKANVFVGIRAGIVEVQ